MDKNPNTEERPICRNCGSTKTDAEINAAGWIACCPERDTRPEQAHAAKDSPTLQCRPCSICEGQNHHWMDCGEEDAAGEPVMSCKHCEATRPIEDGDDD